LLSYDFPIEVDVRFGFLQKMEIPDKLPVSKDVYKRQDLSIPWTPRWRYRHVTGALDFA